MALELFGGAALRAITKEGIEEALVNVLREHPEDQAARINRNLDTFLHAAITNGLSESAVGEMVDLIEGTFSDILAAENDEGNTPLHSAATRGSVSICQRLVRTDKSLVEKRNKEGETPLFLAALNGRKDAFFYLHNVCKDITSSDLWRRNNGDTILHCTIQRMHFGQ